MGFSIQKLTLQSMFWLSGSGSVINTPILEASLCACWQISVNPKFAIFNTLPYVKTSGKTPNFLLLVSESYASIKNIGVYPKIVPSFH